MTTASTAIGEVTNNMSKAEAREAIRRMFAQMAEADKRIAHNQEEIDRLRAETRAMLATLGHTFDEG